MDCSLAGFSVHEISQTRILEWVAISYSRGSSQPRNWTCISCTAGRFFSTAPPGKPPVAVVLMVFPVVMYRCQRWTIKMAENQRIDACELWGWRRLLRVSWFARRSNLSVLTEIHPEYSLQGLMLKLKLHYFGHLIQRANSLEETLMLRKTESKRGSGWQRMWWLDGIIDSMDMSWSNLWEMVKDGKAQKAIVHKVTEMDATEKSVL